LPDAANTPATTSDLYSLWGRWANMHANADENGNAHAYSKGKLRNA
jgi:hypothetical protein